MCICFPKDTTVVTKKGVKRLDEMQPGDEILTLSRKSGTPKWTPFYAWGHRDVNAVAEFVVLKLSGRETLKISSEHLLFVEGEKGTKVAMPAGQVVKGDKLFHLGQSGSAQLLIVDDITAEVSTGVYAPFTFSGSFLANGFLVGCYANVGQDFELAHRVMAPLRTWYRIRSSPSKSDVHQNDIHGYPKQLMKLRDFLGISWNMENAGVKSG